MIHFVNTWPLSAALALLPPRMDSSEARALILAIGRQESQFRARRQLRGGPARGLWQFELTGAVAHVLTHKTTRGYALLLCEAQLVTPAASAVYEAIEHNDILAAGFARLNLWWLPGALPARTDPSEGWRQYLAAWRPGDPRPAEWAANYRHAWACVAGEDD